MKKLSITLHLKVPVIPGKYPINLDSLLYWSAYEGSDENEDVAQEILARALDKAEGVYKSSDMIYLQTPERSISQSEAVFMTSMNWKEFRYKTSKTSIMELGGPYRSRLTTYLSIDAAAVRFYAVGNPDLIEFLISSASCIGRGNNQGHGEIAEIVINEIDEDLSWYADNAGVITLNRCLPTHVIKATSKLSDFLQQVSQDNMVESAVKSAPPYTTSKADLGYSTFFKREVLTSF